MFSSFWNVSSVLPWPISLIALRWHQRLAVRAASLMCPGPSAQHGKQAQCLSLETFWHNQTRPGVKNSHPSYALKMSAWRKAIHFQNFETLLWWPTKENGGTADERQGGAKGLFDAGVVRHPCWVGKRGTNELSSLFTIALRITIENCLLILSI